MIKTKLLGEHWTHFILYEPQKGYGLDINNYIWLSHKLYSTEAIKCVWSGVVGC